MQRTILFTTLSVIIFGAIAWFGLSFLWPDFSWSALFNKKGFSQETVLAEPGTVTKTVVVNNAKLVARDDFELSFPFAGRIDSLSTEEGLIVSAQSELAKLDTSELELEREKAAAVMRQSQANLGKVIAGTRSGVVTISSDKVRGFKTTLSGNKKALVDALRAAYTTADDAIRNQADQTMTNPRSDSPQISFTLSDASLESEIESERHAIESTLSDWEDEANGLKTSDNLTKKNTSTEKKLGKIRTFLDDLAYGLNGVTAGGGLTQETLDTWKAALATARTNVSTAKSDLTTAFNAYRGTGRDLTVAESELGLQQSGNVSQDIDISRFQLEEAERALDIAEEKLLQAKLLSPRDNLIVKKIYPDTGERVSVGEPVINLATTELKIQIDIPEEDMAGIALGNHVNVTLEAFPYSPPLEGTIEFIEPKEILKNESVYYRLYATLKEQHPEWRTGMTGDAKIQSGQAASVLALPRSALYQKNKKQFVQRTTWDGFEEIEVTPGLTGETLVEIKNGLQAGDEIARYPKLP